MKMPDQLKERRDELSGVIYESRQRQCGHYEAEYISDGFDQGFNAAWEELTPVVEALQECVKPLPFAQNTDLTSYGALIIVAGRIVKGTEALEKIGLKE